MPAVLRSSERVLVVLKALEREPLSRDELAQRTSQLTVKQRRRAVEVAYAGNFIRCERGGIALTPFGRLLVETHRALEPSPTTWPTVFAG